MTEVLEKLPKEKNRSDIKAAAAALVDYLQSERIVSLILLDRAARPAYLAVRAFWEQEYPGQRPGFNTYFLNPRGFLTDEDLRADCINSECSRWEVESLKGRVTEDISALPSKWRSQPEIEADFRAVFSTSLHKNKNHPALLFDNCIHEGGSIKPVKRTLVSLGFLNLRIGVISEVSNYSGVHPDLVIFPGRATSTCNFFGVDRMVRKPFDSVVSERNIFTFSRADSARLRQELG